MYSLLLVFNSVSFDKLRCLVTTATTKAENGYLTPTLLLRGFGGRNQGVLEVGRKEALEKEEAMAPNRKGRVS